jgi:hypothetical protein
VGVFLLKAFFLGFEFGFGSFLLAQQFPLLARPLLFLLDLYLVVGGELELGDSQRMVVRAGAGIATATGCSPAPPGRSPLPGGTPTPPARRPSPSSGTPRRPSPGSVIRADVDHQAAAVSPPGEEVRRMPPAPAVLVASVQPERLGGDTRDVRVEVHRHTWSRSSHDSKPTWSPVVDDHHNPGK